MREFTGQHQNMLRYNNSKSVIRVIQENKNNYISRADIAIRLQMSPTSITRIIASLMELNLIRQEETFSKGVGRNGINICINKDAFYSLGFAIDNDYLKMCILDGERNSIAEEIQKLANETYKVETLLEKGREMFQQLCETHGILMEKVTCMGISCCGLVEPVKGISRFSPQLGWKNVNIKAQAEKIFKLPVCVDNDIKLALIGATFQSIEMHSADVAYMSIGSGVGVAVMYQGKMVRGINNAAGEMGHMMFSVNGYQCVCGKQGCLSAYISEHGVIKNCCDEAYEIGEFGDLMKYYHQGDSWAVNVIEEVTKNMASAFCNIIYAYNPQYLLIGGNMVVDFPEIYEMAKEKFLDLINLDFNLDIIIKKREFKNNEVLGAAYTAQEKYIDQLLTAQ